MCQALFILLICISWSSNNATVTLFQMRILGAERISKLPKVTQLRGEGGRFWARQLGLITMLLCFRVCVCVLHTLCYRSLFSLPFHCWLPPGLWMLGSPPGLYKSCQKLPRPPHFLFNPPRAYYKFLKSFMEFLINQNHSCTAPHWSCHIHTSPKTLLICKPQDDSCHSHFYYT